MCPQVITRSREAAPPGGELPGNCPGPVTPAGPQSSLSATARAAK